MVRIRKTKKIPAILSGKGTDLIKAMSDAYDINPRAYEKAYHKTSNPYKFDFDGDVYGPEGVKAQLKLEQGNKCCFCENKDFDDVAYGDVEHYRPKSAFAKSDTDSKLIRPGYYWMAYNWENLFFSCQICNQRHKKNFFPLTDETKRARNHHDSLETIDYTLLIDPAKEDPGKHIGFRKEVPFFKSSKGQASIKYYGIDRDKLNEKRRKHLEEVRRNILLSKIDIANLTPSQKRQSKIELGARRDQELIDIINTAKTYVATAATKDAPFAALVRNNFKKLPRK